MAKDDLFKGMDKREILTMLRTNAHFVQNNVETTMPLTEEEIQEYKDNLAVSSAERHKIEAEKTAVLEKFKEQLSPHKKVIAETSKILANGHKIVVTDLYALQDYDNDRMVFYTPDGEIHSTRRLRSNEKESISIKKLVNQ